MLVFKDGNVEFTQQGQMQENELRVLLKGLGVFRESDELREQARNKHMAGYTREANMLLTQEIQKDPSKLVFEIRDQIKNRITRSPDEPVSSDSGVLSGAIGSHWDALRQ